VVTVSTYDAGQASLSIVPTFKGVVAAIEKQATEGAKAFASTFNDLLRRSLELPSPTSAAAESGAKSGGAFAEAFKERVEAAFQSLPEAEVNADTAEAEARIQQIRADLVELSGKRIGVDISDAEALAQLGALKAELDEIGSRSPSVQVQVDTARASASLAEIAAEADAVGQKSPTIDVNANTADASSEISGLLVGVLALGPALIPIGAAAVAGLGGIATVAAAGAAGLGVLTLGLSGVSKAMGLLGKEQQASAADAAEAAKKSAASARAEASAAASLQSADEALTNTRRSTAAQQVQAAEQVANARRSLGDAETQAAEQIRQADEQVATAEYGVTQANEQATEAMTALNDAREQAVRDLQSYADAAVDANLNVTQAQLDLTDAQNQYNADQQSGTATALQLQQDSLNVAKAQQALTEAQQQATDATQDNTKAQQAGVDGAPGVVSAVQQVAQAQHDQQTAALALTDAQRNQAQVAASSAESIVKAQQAISDAVREEATVQAQAAYSVQAAENSVADAARRVADAHAEAAQSSVTSLSKIQAQLALLPPGVVAFATAVRANLLPLFNQLKNVSAQGLLPSFQQSISNLKPLFAPLTAFVSGLAKTMGGLAVSASKALTDPFWTQFFAYVSATAGPTLATFAKIIGNLAEGFAGLVEAFQPITDKIGAGLVSLSAKFAKFGTGNGNGLQAFIGYIQQNGPLVVSTIGKIADAIAGILKAAAPLGPPLLKIIGDIASLVSTITGLPGHVGTAAIAFAGVTAVALKLDSKLGDVLKLFGASGWANGPLHNGLSSLASKISDLVGSGSKAGLSALKSGIQGVAGKFADLGKAAATAATDFAAATGRMLASAATWVVESIADAAAVAASYIAAAASAAAAWIAANAAILLAGGGITLGLAAIGIAVYELATHWSTVWGGIKKAAEDAYDGIKKVVDGIVTFFTTTIPNAVSGVVDFIKKRWSTILVILTGPIGLAIVELKKHWNTIKNDASDAVDAVVGFFEKLPGRIINGLADLGKDLLHLATTAFNKLSDAARSAGSDLIGFVEKLPDRILNALGDFGKLLYNAGKAIIEGLINGIKDAAKKVAGVIGGVAHDVKHGFEEVLHIASPSKVFEGYGGNIVQGLVNGITENAASAVQAAASLAAGVAQPFVGQVYGGDGSTSPTFSTGIVGSLAPVIAAQAVIGATRHGLSPVDFFNNAAAQAPYAVIAQFGTETITAMSQRVATNVVVSKVTAALQIEGQGTPGSSLTHLAGA
jgi:hypothetical protein